MDKTSSNAGSFILKIAPNGLYASGLGLVAWGGFSVYVSVRSWWQTGVWCHQTGWELVQFFPVGSQRWLVEPDSWLGMHEIISWFLNIPLGIPLIVAGGATMIGGALMVDEGELKAKEAQMREKGSWRKER